MHQTLKFLLIFLPFFLISDLSYASKEYRELIFKNQFNELEARLKRANDDYLKGRGLEELDEFKENSFFTFEDDDFVELELLNQLLKWEVESPSVYVKVFLGGYYRNKAFFHRGEALSKDTSTEQHKLFKEYNKKSLKKYTEAIKLSNDHVAAYSGFIRLDQYLNHLSFRNYEVLNQDDSNNTNEDWDWDWENWTPPLLMYSYQTEPDQYPLFSADILIHIDERLKKSPALWGTYIDTKQIKWGGSEREMELILKDAKNYVDDEIYYWLKGHLVSEKAISFEKNNHWKEVYELTHSHYKDITSLGYSDRAIGYLTFPLLIKSSYNLKKYDECIVYADKLLSNINIDQFDGEALGYYGNCLYVKKEYQKTADVYKWYLKIKPDEPNQRWGLNQLSDTYERMGNYPEAYAVLEYLENNFGGVSLENNHNRMKKKHNGNLAYEGTIESLLKPSDNFFKLEK